MRARAARPEQGGRVRRAVAGMATAAIASLALVAPATTAMADPALTVNVDPPGVDGASATVSGSAEMAGQLDWITGAEITMTSRLHPGTSPSCGDCADPVGQKATHFSFTTQRLDYNGPYDVAVVVSGRKILDAVLNNAPVTTRQDTSFNIEVAPAPPANVTASSNPDRSVTLKWTRNTEPDLVGYQVQRTGPGGSGFQPVGPNIPQPPDGSTVSWTDTTTAQSGGQFQYLVVAVRPDGNGEVSNRAIAASAGAAVSVPPPPGSPGGPGGPGGPGSPAGGPGGPGALAAPGPGGAFTTGSPAPLDLSSFLAAGGAPPKIAVPGGVTLPDGTFSATLPFGPKNASDAGADSVEILGHSTSRRTLLLPVATGLLMCVFALHLRRFNRRVLAQPLEH